MNSTGKWSFFRRIKDAVFHSAECKTCGKSQTTTHWRDPSAPITTQDPFAIQCVWNVQSDDDIYAVKMSLRSAQFQIERKIEPVIFGKCPDWYKGKFVQTLHGTNSIEYWREIAGHPEVSPYFIHMRPTTFIRQRETMAEIGCAAIPSSIPTKAEIRTLKVLERAGFRHATTNVNAPIMVSRMYLQQIVGLMMFATEEMSVETAYVNIANMDMRRFGDYSLPNSEEKRLSIVSNWERI